jgi:hypothetical protein
MEQVLSSNDFFAPGEESTSKSVFDETGVRNPRVYFRLARRIVRKQLGRIRLLCRMSLAVSLTVLLACSTTMTPVRPEKSVNTSSVVDDADRFDLSAEDY